MGVCLKAHGIEGYNQLTKLLRPHLDLRTFYFGVRSVLYRMCVPRDENETYYTNLTEITTRSNGEVIAVEFNPLRKLQFSTIKYMADIRSPLLSPLKNPIAQGDEKLSGFFSKQIFCSILLVLNDVIKLKASTEVAFEPLEISCGDAVKGIIRREIKNDGPRVISYKFFLKNSTGKEIASEMISFIQ